MVTPNDMPSPQPRAADRGDYGPIPRTRRRSPSLDSDRKRHRIDDSPNRGLSRSRYHHERSWDRDSYDRSRRTSSHHIPTKRGPPHSAPSYNAGYDRNRGPPRGYENGFTAQNGVNGAQPMYGQRAGLPVQHPNLQQTAKSRRLYIGNIPFQAGLTDVALTQFFSALFVAGFRANNPGESLPVVSFWLHSDGKFGFMELRGEQEAVNMMQFNGVFLHGRPLRVNRPSDYRPELHNPAGMSLVPDEVNIRAVMDLCNQLGGVVSAPAQLAAIAASLAAKESQPQIPSSVPSSVPASVAPGGASNYSMPLRSQTPASNPPGLKSEPTSSAGDPMLHISRSIKQSRVLSLRNLVTDDDLQGNDEEFQEILEDVENECANYGLVRSVNIPRSGTWKGSAFVEFNDSAETKKALEALGQKVFDGRKIVAVIVDGCETAADAANRPPPS